MSDIAIIKTGGKQYKVEAGDSIKVEKIEAEDNSKLEFEDILAGKKVTATVVAQGRHDKITVLKFHSKKRYQRTMGHRQAFTQIKIEAIK
jgi:large subunit ribosomal protein L21